MSDLLLRRARLVPVGPGAAVPPGPVDVRVVGDRSFSDSAFGSSSFLEQPRFPAPGDALAIWPPVAGG